jgi:hypothetical protein
MVVLGGSFVTWAAGEQWIRYRAFRTRRARSGTRDADRGSVLVVVALADVAAQAFGREWATFASTRGRFVPRLDRARWGGEDHRTREMP